MGFLVRLFLALVAAIAIGVSTAWLSLDDVANTEFAANGAWRVLPDIQSSSLNLYERAALARFNLLQPVAAEAVNLTASEDETGTNLTGNCNYRIEGSTLPSRSWSVAAYGPGNELIANPQNRYAIRAEDAANPDGSYVFHISSKSQTGHWLPLDDARTFSLTLRLYGPEQRIVAAPTSFNAPRVIKESCQ